ncbi:MAG: hypothetical protein J2P31_08980, partial [Blastocatellia bacterium]|nr:hypothetical protein [Blastocatellia bacterium]
SLLADAGSDYGSKQLANEVMAHSAKLRGHARQLARDRSMFDDIVQETILRDSFIATSLRRAPIWERGSLPFCVTAFSTNFVTRSASRL